MGVNFIPFSNTWTLLRLTLLLIFAVLPWIVRWLFSFWWCCFGKDGCYSCCCWFRFRLQLWRRAYVTGCHLMVFTTYIHNQNYTYRSLHSVSIIHNLFILWQPSSSSVHATYQHLYLGFLSQPSKGHTKSAQFEVQPDNGEKEENKILNESPVCEK